MVAAAGMSSRSDEEGVHVHAAMVWIDGASLGLCEVSISQTVITFVPESGAEGFSASMSRLAVHALSSGKRDEDGATTTTSSADEEGGGGGGGENGDEGMGACLYMQIESDEDCGDECMPFVEVRIVLKSTSEGRADEGELEDLFARVTACVEAAEAAAMAAGGGETDGGSGAAATMMMMMMNMMTGEAGNGDDYDQSVAERLDEVLIVSSADDVDDATRFEDAEEDQVENGRNGG